MISVQGRGIVVLGMKKKSVTKLKMKEQCRRSVLWMIMSAWPLHTTLLM